MTKTNVANGIQQLFSRLTVVAILVTTPCLAAGAPEAGAPKPVAAKSDAAKPEAVKSDSAQRTPPSVGDAGAAPDDAPSSDAQASVRKYCVNIAAAATDARFAWQSKQLLEIETRVKARIAELDAKQADLNKWLDHRDTIAKQAKESLVGIYAKMKPELAAAQIAALDDEMATAVLAALSPRQAGAIFSEITPPERAAKLAGLLASPTASQNDKKL